MKNMKTFLSWSYSFCLTMEEKGLESCLRALQTYGCCITTESGCFVMLCDHCRLSTTIFLQLKKKKIHKLEN